MSYQAYSDLKECADQIINDLHRDICMGIPLGIGKPVQLVNEIYRRAKEDPSIKLKIMTALSLERPTPKPGLESKFLTPVFDRIFKGYVTPLYIADLKNQSLPDNIEICEFYFKSGSMMNNDYAQQHYISCNYTHVARDMMDQGVNLLAQQVAKGEHNGKPCLSLSSNADITSDILPLIRHAQRTGKNIKLLAQVNQQLPFMLNDALVEIDEFDYILDNPSYYTALFAPPNLPVSPVDFAIGLHASSLIKDGGTLQIGIGSMGDAIVYSCLLRQQQNASYKAALDELGQDSYRSLADKIGASEAFEQGLYGSSEMFVNGFMHLIQNKIMKRKVYDDYHIQTLINEGRLHENIHPDHLDELVGIGFFGEVFHGEQVRRAKHFGVFNEHVSWQHHQLCIDGEALGTDPYDLNTISALKARGMGTQLKHGIVMHGGFFLGPQAFYQTLRDLDDAQREAIGMTSVGHVNQLLVNKELVVEQRRHARFINTGLMATLNGAVASDGLESGKVVSGVGGQYNFVSMAHALPGARSILLIRSTRMTPEGLSSNIVYHYGHTTIPRHLRDIVITEYGAADLRGKTDSQVMQAMLNITDSRFQPTLLEQAQRNGKLPQDYVIPERFRHNTADRINAIIGQHQQAGLFPALPLGTDFSETELIIAKALKQIKALSDSKVALAKTLFKAAREHYSEDKAYGFLERMDLLNPQTTKQRIEQKLFLHQLKANGYL